MGLFDFINEHLDDDRIMNVLYYHLRTEYNKHDYSLNGVDVILLDRKYTPKNESINIAGLCTESLDSTALLMSVRAILLDPKCVDYCKDDRLLFQRVDGFSWIFYCKLLQEIPEDDDFDNLLNIMWSLYEDDSISDEDKIEFDELTIEPPILFDWDRYIELAKTAKTLDDGVIPDHYFLEDNSLTDYTVPLNIRYIGNTAFSYCNNLKILRISSPDVHFGTCPIIECRQLEHIVVPVGYKDYLCQVLTYYKDIITEEQIPAAIIAAKIQEPADITPGNNKIDPNKLKHVFDTKVTTYNYFWYLSFLSIVKERGVSTIPIVDLEIRMLALAWPMICQDNLDFGKSDQLKAMIADIRSKLVVDKNATSPNIERYFQDHISQISRIVAPLGKNVPFRFLSPWIKYTNDAEVMSLSQIADTQTPYALFDSYIEIGKEWCTYFTDHYDEQKKFIVESLRLYLKKYNSDLALLRSMLRLI